MSFLHTSSTDPDVTLTATMVAQAAHRAKQVSLRQLLLHWQRSWQRLQRAQTGCPVRYLRNS